MRIHVARLLTIAALVLGGGAMAILLLLDRFSDPTLDPDPGRVSALEAEIERLQADFEVRTGADPLLAAAAAADGDVLIAIRTGLVQEVAGWAARSYLNDVRLHLAPNVTVEEGDDVRVSIGPIRARAGEWKVRVTILRVAAMLSADTIALAYADSLRMSTAVAVAVSEAEGDAVVDFTWDAATLASVVCRDFEINESFGGVVAPFTYRVSGAFRFEADRGGIVATPEFDRPRMHVSPRPTEASWERVKALLDHQNNIFRCGLALQPDDLVEKLERLLGEGFDFRLPDVLFRPIRLPARVADQVSIRDEALDVISTPVHLRLTPEAIWYGSDVYVGGPTESTGLVSFRTEGPRRR